MDVWREGEQEEVQDEEQEEWRGDNRCEGDATKPAAEIFIQISTCDEINWKPKEILVDLHKWLGGKAGVCVRVCTPTKEWV